MVPQELRKDSMREIMGRFATGVTVVTTNNNNKLHGMTANSFTSLSLNPPLVLVCIDKMNDTHIEISKTQSFAVNFLASTQKELSDVFAKKEYSSDFHGIPFWISKTGSPILDNVLAYVECKLWNSYDGGDHTIFVGEVINLGQNEKKQPLIFYTGKYFNKIS